MADAERILSQNEVDALLSAIDSGAQVAGPAEAATAYDFRHPVRLGREQLRALQALHDAFARQLQAALSGLLRLPCEAKVAGVHALSAKEAVRTLPSPSVTALLSCEPLDGWLVLELNPALAVTLVERLLGSGKSGPPAEIRPLTALEWGVFDTLLARLLDLLREAWAPAATAVFRVLRRESDPGALALSQAEEMAVLVVLEVVVGDQRGSLDLIFPVRALEAGLARMKAGPSSKGAGGDPALPKRISPAELAVSAHLPAGTLRMQEIRELKPGDLIVTGHPAAAAVLLSVEGSPKFVARLGRSKDKRAAKILGAAGREAVATASAAVMDGGGAAPAPGGRAVEALLAVPLAASAVLAERKASLKDVLSLRPGDLLEFPRRADAPLELRVGGRRLADGVAVRVGEHFGLRVTSIADPRDRVRTLGS